MASLKELLSRLYGGKQIPIRTRRGGGLGDPETLSDALARGGDPDMPHGPFIGDNVQGAPEPLEPFDLDRMIPFVSSNVDGAYFIRNRVGLSSGDFLGNLYILFQKRRGDKIGGEPIGPARAYGYQNVNESVWDELFSAASKGGFVWDVIRHGGIDGDRIS